MIEIVIQCTNYGITIINDCNNIINHPKTFKMQPLKNKMLSAHNQSETS